MSLKEFRRVIALVTGLAHAPCESYVMQSISRCHTEASAPPILMLLDMRVVYDATCITQSVSNAMGGVVCRFPGAKGFKGS